VRDAVQRHRSGGDGSQRAAFKDTARLQLVYVDGRQLEKVLATLLAHTRRDGTAPVLVTTRRLTAPDERMTIEIDDPAAPQSDDELTWSGDLDACRRVLEAHGGTLEVVLQPSGGLRFHLELPITELSEKQAP
jgi:hypothetical protein